MSLNVFLYVCGPALTWILVTVNVVVLEIGVVSRPVSRPHVWVSVSSKTPRLFYSVVARS